MLKETAEVRLTIGSQFEDLDLLDTVSEAVLTHAEIPDDYLEHTALAIREAAANAIEHGNGQGSDEKVDILIRLEAELLTVEVRDRGSGFDPDQIPDPLAPENLLKPRGRGIFLTRRFVDSVEYEFDGGTVMILRKKLGAAGGSKSRGETETL